VAWRTGNLPRAFAFYGNGLYTVDTADPEVLDHHLRNTDEVFAVVSAADLGKLGADTLPSMFIVDRERLSRRDLLLVSNMSRSGSTRLDIDTWHE
jgi:hypothetical protein